MAPSRLGSSENGADMSDETLFDPTILEKINLADRPEIKFDPNLSILKPGEGLVVRPLKRMDYTRGFLNVLSQLTVVGEIPENEFLDTFALMKNTPNTYYVVVIEDQSTEEVVGCATLVMEQKFVHHCAKRARIEDVVVSDAYRGKQLGKLLLATLTLLGKHLNSYKISLDCNDKMAPFYEGLGFIKEPGNGNSLCIRY